MNSEFFFQVDQQSEAPVTVSVPTDGLIAHYPLNEDSQANDWTTSYDGVITGTPVFTEIGTIFSGNDFQSISSGYTAEVNIAVSLWFNVTNPPATNQYATLFDDYSGPGSRRYLGISINDQGLLGISRYTGTYHAVGVSLSAVPYFGLNTHLVAQYNGITGDLEVYINNELKVSLNDQTEIIPQSPYGIFSALEVGNTNTLNGTGSNFRIYNRTLSETEITALYNEGLKPQLPQPTTDNLVAYYPLTGTAEDAWASYDGVENGGLTYIDDSVRGSVANFSNHTITHVGPISAESLSIWVNFDNVSIFSHILRSELYDNWAIVYSPAEGLFFVDVSGFKYWTGTLLTANVWYHLVLVRNSATSMSLYLNNTIKGTFNGLVADNFISNLCLGKRFDDNSYPFDGQMSSLRVYNKALTPTEIQTIYRTERVQHSINIDDGLVAYYPLEKNSWDNHYNQYDGTANGGVTYDGISASFDGTGSYVTLPLSTITLNYTYAVWCKLSITNNSMIMYGKTTLTTSGCYVGFSTEGFVGYNGGGANHVYTGLTGITVDTWYHVVLVKSGTSLKLYLNGILKHSVTNTAVTESTNNDCKIGKYPSSNYGDYMNGNIATVRDYNKALTQDEITILYNTEKTKFGL